MSRTDQPIDDEETIRLERKLFAQRRRRSRLARLKPLLIVAAVLIVIGAGVYAVGFSSLFAARTVAVTGNHLASAATIQRAAALPVDQPLARVDLGAIETRVERLPAVLSARATRDWPHTVRVTVTERRAVAVVPDGTTFRGLSADGVLFRTWAKPPPNLPTVQSAGANRRALAEAAKVVGSLDPGLLHRVDFVSVATIDQIQLKLRSGQTVLWGSSADSATKAEVLAVLVRRPNVHQIDVRVPGRPTTS